MQNFQRKNFLYFTFLIFVFCEKNEEKRDWSNNSYGIILNSNDTIKLDLYSSTYCFFDNDYYNGINNWKIEEINNSTYLKLEDSFTIILDKNFKKNKKGNIIGYNNTPVEIIKLKPKWDSLILDGSWIKKTDFEITKKINEGIYVLPPPPPPPSINIENFVYPPILKIEKNTTYFYDWYVVDTSKISMSLNKDFIIFHSENRRVKKYINMINIKNRVKDTLYVEIIYRTQFDSFIENETLIKVKR